MKTVQSMDWEYQAALLFQICGLPALLVEVGGEWTDRPIHCLEEGAAVNEMKPFEVDATSPESGKLTALSHGRKMFAPNYFRNSARHFIVSRLAVLRNESPVV